MKAAIFSTLLVMSAPIAFGETWVGDGKVYDDQRVELGTFDVQVEITRVSASLDKTRTEIQTSDGETIVVLCTLNKGDNRWSTSCDDGFEGGGYYFDSGLATEYLERDDRARAISIAFDSDDRMRISITELQNNNAVRFYTETLTRRQSVASRVDEE